MPKTIRRNEHSEEIASNRMFLLTAGCLGGLVLLGLMCIAGYLLFRNNASQQNESTAVAQMSQQQATVQAGIMRTIVAENLTQTAAMTNTVPPTNTPVIAEATATFSTTSILATATLSAAFTQIAVSTQTIIPTATEPSSYNPPPHAIPGDTPTLSPSVTPGSLSPTGQSLIPTLTIQEQFALADAKIKESMPGSFSYIAPVTMQLGESFTVKLVLNLSQTPEELATAVVATSGLPTSPATPGQVVNEEGEPIQIVSNRIMITPRMQAILLSEDPEAFSIQNLHYSPVQVVGIITSTEWEWNITAMKDGNQNLLIVIYQLVQIDNKEDWRKLETYREDINVQVSMAQRMKALDWKWIAAPIITLLLIPAFWRWYDSRKKQASAAEESGFNKKPKRKPKSRG